MRYSNDDDDDDDDDDKEVCRNPLKQQTSGQQINYIGKIGEKRGTFYHFEKACEIFSERKDINGFLMDFS